MTAIRLRQQQFRESHAATPAPHVRRPTLTLIHLKAPCTISNLPVVPRGCIANRKGCPLLQRMLRIPGYRDNLTCIDFHRLSQYAHRTRCVIREDFQWVSILVPSANAQQHTKISLADVPNRAPRTHNPHHTGVSQHNPAFASLTTDIDGPPTQRMGHVCLPAAVDRFSQHLLLSDVGK